MTGIIEKKINTMEDLLTILQENNPYMDSIKAYRGTYLYRGLPDADYKLKTSLERNCKDKKKVLEKKMLDNFAKYTSGETDINRDNIWEQMILAQHHGLPTRLLDWTHSPLVALNFATLEDLAGLDDHDCVLWRINYESLHENLPKEYRAILGSNSNIFSVDMLTKAADSIEAYDNSIGSESMVILEPPSFDIRIINQYAFFSIVPNNVTDIETFLDENTSDTVKYIISKDLKWQIRDFLDEINISERTIYPGLDGISKWIARHYYVR